MNADSRSQLLSSLVTDQTGQTDEESLEAVVRELAKHSESGDDLHYLIVAATDVQRLNWLHSVIDEWGHLEAGDDGEMEELIDELLLPKLDPGNRTGLMEQARRNAQRRETFLAEYPCLNAQEVDRLHGPAASDASSRSLRLIDERRIFGLGLRGDRVFPEFQFDESGQPKAVIARILKALGTDIGPWQTAIWFTTPNQRLGKRRPVDLLDSAADEVVDAASRRSEPNLF